VERRDEPLDEGLERLAAAAREASLSHEGSFADRIYGRLVGQTSLDDDIALVAIESLPIGPSLELTLDARPGVLTGLRSTLARWLAGEGVPDDHVFDISLATSEAASNAIEHAYGGREGRFSVSASLDDTEIRVTVIDRGRWRVTKPRGGGRGLTLMRGLVDSVALDQGEGGTSVTLTKRLSRAPR
ncbi:MAG TPA: ATP-binding protein, partial [Solirubrobacteraceae bacterium]|nr:ATP-binding protein [Solirubrobacteraceae bacterium]